MIPKVIHYCWFGGKPIPSETIKYIETWRKFCPDYKITKWDESNFDVNCHPFVKAAYEAKQWAFVSDYARLYIVYTNGGIYLDTDVELIKNLDFLLNNHCYIGLQQGGDMCATGLGFGAEKYNPAVLKMMKMYDQINFDIEKRNEFICPILNTEAIKQLGAVDNKEITNLVEATIYPARYFDPISPGNKYLLGNDTVSIHHYAASWTSKNNRIKRRIIRLLGDKNIYKIKNMFNK